MRRRMASDGLAPASHCRMRRGMDLAKLCDRDVRIDLRRGEKSLRVPPGNRLEALRGDRKGQWSIRINDQWRICFRWVQGDAFDVEIVDYH